MADTIRWGILGAANFAKGHMAPAINMAENAVLAALATSSRDKAAPFEAIAPGLRVFDDYAALLDDPDIDAVYIPLPNHLHVEWTIRALEAGKHVLCEKPIAMRADEFDRLIAARDASGKLASEAYMIVHHPQWQRARQLVQEGVIGTLRQVDAAFSYDNREDTENIRNRPETGGGALPDIGVYTFGSTRFVTGQEPTGMRATIEREGGVDTLSRFDATFDGFRLTGFVSMRLAPRQEMTFHGDKGWLKLAAPFNAEVYGDPAIQVRAGGSEWIERFAFARQYQLQVEAFGRAVRGEAEWPVPLEWSRGTQRMIDMAFDAA